MRVGPPITNASLHGLTAVGVLWLAACAGSNPPTAAPTPTPTTAPTAAAPTPKAAATSQAASAARVNDVCPITGDTSDPKFVAVYGGRTIAFCCEHCLREFRESDEAGKAAIAAKAAR